MTQNAHPPGVADTGKPIASRDRRFWAYAMQVVGAVIGACATVLTFMLVPAHIARASSMDDYGAAVDLGWTALGLGLVVIPASAIGAGIATLGLPVLRGYRRSPVAYVLIGIAVLGLVVSVAAYVMIQEQRGH